MILDDSMDIDPMDVVGKVVVYIEDVGIYCPIALYYGCSLGKVYLELVKDKGSPKRIEDGMDCIRLIYDDVTYCVVLVQVVDDSG